MRKLQLTMTSEEYERLKDSLVLCGLSFKFCQKHQRYERNLRNVLQYHKELALLNHLTNDSKD